MKRKAFITTASLALALFILSLPGSAQKATPGEKPKKTVKMKSIKTAVTAKNKAETKKAKEKKPSNKKPASNEKSDQKKKDERRAKKIREVISYGLHDERKAAVTRILLVKDPGIKKELVDFLLKMLPREYNTEVKVKALTVLQELKLKKGAEILKPLLSDNSDEVKIATVYTIKENELTGLKDDLVAILKKQDLETDSRYLEALIVTLGEFKAKELAEYARKAITKTGTASTVRQRLVLFLGKLEDTGSKDFLLKLFTDSEEEQTVRCYAINSLARMKIKDAIEPARKVLNEIDTYSFKKKKRFYSLTMYTVTALVRLGDDSAVPRLMDSLKSPSARVRLSAIALIKELKDKRTIDILKYKMKYDPNAKVQKAAKDALKEMGVETDKKKEKPEKNKAAKTHTKTRKSEQKQP